MNAAPPLPDTDSRYEELQAEVLRLQKVNNALMDRVERDMDRQGSSFSLFQAATALEHQVVERTAALQRTLHALEKSNRELVASNEAAQAASRAKSAFLAAMSHELRTPMNGVIGMTELLLGSELTERQRHSLGVVRQSALSLLTILNDILDFSKIEAGQMNFESAPFDLREATRDVLELLAPQTAAKGIALIEDCVANLPTQVTGDSTRYKQILTNLIGNAIKFTAAGHVRVTGRAIGTGEDHVSLRFEIEDTGIGIRPEVIPKLFSSFTQADNSMTRRFGGTGLGLVIVQRLCKLMGGDCGVTSEFGHGSTFWFELRFAANRASTASDPRAVTQRGAPRARPIELPGRALHILVAEDNPVNQEVAVAILESLGCTSRVANNGREAVDALAGGERFDLVLMDCQMPDVDGFEATRLIRELERERGGHVHIIALTANAMSGDREACLESGMDDFLSKPFQTHELRAVLDNWRCPFTCLMDS
jgi:signal transduction histidine kinase/CheY-like chemotaxis protein